MSNGNDTTEPCVVNIVSGKLLGSVRIMGDLPDAMPHAEVQKLIEALQIVAGLHSLEAKGNIILELKGCRYV
jgi:hypothetical protein